MRSAWTGLHSIVLSLSIVLGSHAATASAQGAAPPSTDAEARALFEAGREAFGSAEYHRALDYFSRAFELSGQPELLYNIGQSADRARRDAVALEAYERFLEAVPDSPYRAQVETRVAFLRAQADVAEPDTEPATDAETAPAIAPGVAAREAAPVEPAPPADAPERPSRVGAWVLAAGGGAVAVTGGVLLALGQAARGRVEDAALRTPWDEVSGDYARAAPLGNAGIAGLAVGLVATGAGLTWALVANDEGDGDEGGASVDITAGAHGIALVGSF